MSKPTTPAIERRYTDGLVERRADGEGKPSRTVRGYAAKFEKKSNNLGGESHQFFEIIQRGAFDDVLRDDVRALFNHDANLILARSRSGEGTLKLGADDVGLWYEFEAPATRAGDDLLESLTRKDVDQSSFAFTISKEGQTWEERTEAGITVATRTIKKVKRLYDVSPVTYPAYEDTHSGIARSLESSLSEFRAEQTPAPAALPPFTLTGARAARFGLPKTSPVSP
jgi:HK97 family phage prohead protease